MESLVDPVLPMTVTVPTPFSHSALAAGIRWSLTALAAAIGSLLLHPAESVAQVPAAEAADSAPSVAASDVARPNATTRSSAPSGKAPVPSKGQPSGAIASSSTNPELDAPERLVWDKMPLQIALGVGAERERAITFAAPMHIGVPQEVASLLRVQTVGRTTYVTALAPFARTRVIAEDRSSGAVMLLDLTASTETRSTQPVTIVSPSVAEAKATASHDGEDDAPPVDMVTLTRFAAQQMYAPRRLLTPHPGIRRIAINPRPLDDLYVGAGVRAIPAAQWRSDALYVAALVLKNLGREPVELDPLSVRGRWQAITFQHGRLLASGSEADTTVVYLVCDRPFEACR